MANLSPGLDGDEGGWCWPAIGSKVASGKAERVEWTMACMRRKENGGGIPLVTPTHGDKAATHVKRRSPAVTGR
jgi:hypothetical protein